MQGNWYIFALACLASVVSVIWHLQICMIVLCVWLLYLYKTKRLRKLPIFLSLAVYFFFYFYIPTFDQTSLIQLDNSPKTHKGKIVGSILNSNKKIEFLLENEQTKQKQLIIYFPENNSPIHFKTQLKRGAVCNIFGTEELPEQGRNPGQFDYRDYLIKKGVTSQIIVASWKDVKCEGSSFAYRFDKLRNGIIRYVETSFQMEVSSWLLALVFGHTTELPIEVIELFREWSLSHLLAISGLHVGLVVSFAYFLLIKLNLFTKEKAQWIMLIFLPLYAFLAGGEPSVWRASLMVFIFILFEKINRKMPVSDVISIVFLILMLHNPLIIYHVGFQMSFLVSFGLILSRSWFMQSSHSLWIQMLKISFISQMMIMPLQFAYFNYVQPLAILLNVLIVPYFSFFVIPLMFLFLFLTPIPILKDLFSSLFIFIHQTVLMFLDVINRYVSFPWKHGALPMFAVFMYMLLLYLLMTNLERRKWSQAFTIGCSIVCLICVILLKPYFSPNGKITMLDIGQGDAFIIELPYRKGIIMMDLGASFSFPEGAVSDRVYVQVIKPYLDMSGIHQIDAVFLSHEDVDHIGSLSFLLEDYDVDNLIISDYYKSTKKEEQQWLQSVKKISSVRSGDIVTIQGQRFHVTSPKIQTDSANENSLVLYSEFGNKSWLFTGDIGHDTEMQLLQRFANLQVDVLKVGHHGSKHSTLPEFVDHIQPSYALISVGKHNRYGHPTKEVLDTLNERGITILRTDESGAVIYEFTEGEGTFFKFIP